MIAQPHAASKAIRLSLAKGASGWTVTLEKGEYLQTFIEPTAWQALQLVNDLCGPATCQWCGAPLWSTENDNPVCSRHWEHYPQPQSERFRTTTDGYGYWARNTPPEHSLEGISGHAMGLPPKQQDDHSRAWARWKRREKRLLTESVQVQQTTEDGRPLYITQFPSSVLFLGANGHRPSNAHRKPPARRHRQSRRPATNAAPPPDNGADAMSKLFTAVYYNAGREGPEQVNVLLEARSLTAAKRHAKQLVGQPERERLVEVYQMSGDIL